jgi:hypothetical protein
MPTVLHKGPYRFFFYAGDRAEPPHIHTGRDDKECKFWLEPVALANNRGFSRKDLHTIARLIEWNHAILMEGWNEFFQE